MPRKTVVRLVGHVQLFFWALVAFRFTMIVTSLTLVPRVVILQQLECRFDLAYCTAIQTAIMPKVDRPATLRTHDRRRPCAGCGLEPLEFRKQLGFANSNSVRQQRKHRTKQDALFFDLPLEVGNCVSKVGDFALRVGQLRALGQWVNERR
jgi:hypothetical protein